MSEFRTVPATFGGPGFSVRSESHREDLGRYWKVCGVDSEWNTLRQVMLAWPPETLDFEGDPDAQLMLE